MLRTSSGEMAILKKVLRYIRKERFLVILSIVFAAVVVGLTLYLPILQGRAIDQMGPESLSLADLSIQKLLRILLIMGLCSLLTGLLQWLQNIVNNKITFQVVKGLRQAAFEKIQSLPLSYLDKHPTGDLVSRITADADAFSDGLLLGFTQLFTGVLTILGTLLFMLSINWIVTLIVVLLTPVSLFVARFIATHTYDHFQAQSRIRGRQTALIDEMVGGRKVVKAYGREKEVEARFSSINEELRQTSLKAVFYSSLTNPATRFCNSLVYAAAGIGGALLALSGRISVGQLSSVLSYANQYTKPFNEISGVITEFQNAIACAGRLLEFIEAPSEAPDPESPASPETFEGNITFDNISFSYDPEVPLIEGFSLSAKAGQKIAIVGPTGCGKTTLINLLMRFYDPASGRILVEGIPALSMKRSTLRSGFGMVLQDTWIKEGTVRENIAMGLPEASLEEIREAGRLSHADEFIRRLKDGYDTYLHESSDLSEGQRQLLCIARVMLALPPMLILDEATSSIDSRTEMQIQDSFERLTKGRTSFIVAHRLSTIKSADLILVMKDGHIIETGNHQDLLSRGGFYAELYNSQFAN